MGLACASSFSRIRITYNHIIVIISDTASLLHFLALCPIRTISFFRIDLFFFFFNRP